MARIFISYAKEDADAADRMYSELDAAGCDPWLDKEKLLPGRKWQLEINVAIRDSDYFIALLSQNSVGKKGFVQKELREALDVLDTYPEGRVFIIPARLNNCVPSHPQLAEIQWVDLFPDWSKGITRILRVVGFSPLPQSLTKGTRGLDQSHRVIPSLTGTTWAGTDSDGDYYVFKFNLDDMLEYTSPNGTFRNGTWRQENDTVYMEMNKEYSQYNGTITGEVIQGTAQNIAGHEWKWKVSCKPRRG